MQQPPESTSGPKKIKLITRTTAASENPNIIKIATQKTPTALEPLPTTPTQPQEPMQELEEEPMETTTSVHEAAGEATPTQSEDMEMVTAPSTTVEPVVPAEPLQQQDVPGAGMDVDVDSAAVLVPSDNDDMVDQHVTTEQLPEEQQAPVEFEEQVAMATPTTDEVSEQDVVPVEDTGHAGDVDAEGYPQQSETEQVAEQPDQQQMDVEEETVSGITQQQAEEQVQEEEEQPQPQPQPQPQQPEVSEFDSVVPETPIDDSVATSNEESSEDAVVQETQVLEDDGAPESDTTIESGNGGDVHQAQQQQQQEE